MSDAIEEQPDFFTTRLRRETWVHSAAAAIFSGVEWLLRDGVVEAVMIKMKTPTEERCETMCDPFFSWLTLFKRPADDCLLLVWRHFHAHRREVGEIVLRGGGQDRRTRQQEQDNDRPTNHPPTRSNQEAPVSPPPYRHGRPERDVPARKMELLGTQLQRLSPLAS